MSWQIYLIISIFLISLNGLFHRSLMRDDRSNPFAQTIVFLGLGGVIAVCIALFQGKLQLAFPLSLLWNYILLVVLVTPAYVLSYKAYKLIGASEIVTFTITARLWNVIGAFLFLREIVTLKMVIGAIIIIAGIAISRYEQKKFIVNKGVLFALIAAFLYGMVDIDGYYILQKVNATNFLIYSEFLPVFAILLLLPQTLKKLGYYFHLDKAIKLILLSAGDALGSLAMFLSYQAGGKASVIGPLSSTRVFITTLLAIVILKEKTNIKGKIIGAAVTVVGVILLL